jgi:hypothetical protein
MILAPVGCIPVRFFYWECNRPVQEPSQGE